MARIRREQPGQGQAQPVPYYDAVVKPYLANKKDKTFLDHFLLGDDLSEYAQPWRYERLNTVERVLLAQRLKDEPARTSRYLSDLLRLQPPNTDRFLALFDRGISPLWKIARTGLAPVLVPRPVCLR